MTRKDYELIAEAINKQRQSSESGGLVAESTVIATADRIAASLAEDNPRFDRHRFMRACGIEE